MAVQEGVLKRALDVGCAVGRSTFELAREFEEVVGIDYSAAFIHRCQELKMTGRSAYRLKTEGDLGEDKIATIHSDIVSSFSLLVSSMSLNHPGPEQSAVHGGRWLQSSSDGSVWLCSGSQPHLPAPRPTPFLHPSPLYGGRGRCGCHYFSLFLAGAVHSKGQLAPLKSLTDCV